MRMRRCNIASLIVRPVHHVADVIVWSRCTNKIIIMTPEIPKRFLHLMDHRPYHPNPNVVIFPLLIIADDETLLALPGICRL